jgi:hypothetical protein
MNKYVFLATLALVCMATAQSMDGSSSGVASGSDTPVVKCGAGVCVDVVGRSGKIRVGNTFPVTDDPNMVTINMDYIKEVDGAGSKVKGHQFQNFASIKSSKYSDVEKTTYPGSNATVSTFNFTSRIEKNPDGYIGQLAVVFYIFADGAEIDNGENETLCIQPGSLKLNIFLSDWNYYDTSVKFIDFGIEVKGKGGPEETDAPDNCTLREKPPAIDDVPKEDELDMRRLKKGDAGADAEKAKRGKKFSLGGGAQVLLSNSVQIDGEWRDMQEGYPKLETQGSKQLFGFRFDRFQDKAFYDPAVTLAPPTASTNTGGSGDGSTNSASSTAAASVTGLVALMAMFAH